MTPDTQEPTAPVADPPGRPKRWFRGLVTGIVATVAALTGTVATPAPAQASPTLFVNIAVNVPISITGLFGGSGIDRAALEAVKRQIINAINNATLEIKDHLERLEIANLTGCVEAILIDLGGQGDLPIDPRIDFAEDATLCALRVHEQMKVATNARNVDSLGFLTLVAFPGAMAARATAGLPNDQFQVSYIEALQLILSRLAPFCSEGRPQDRPDYWRFYCNGADGTHAEYSQRLDRGEIPEWIKEQVRAEATRNLSYAAAVQVLPPMRELLPKLKRSFVFTAARSNSVVEWNTQGPHFWKSTGNPTNPPAREIAAVATSLDTRDNSRHVVAVVDGQIRHRLRHENGSLTAWSAPGALAHPGTATAAATTIARDGNLYVAAVFDGAIYHRWRNPNGAWTGWTSAGNPGTATSVAATLDAAGTGLHLIATIDGTVRHSLWDTSGGATPWSSAGQLAHPGPATSVAAAPSPEGNILVLAVIDGEVLFRGRLGNGGWTNWAALDSPGFATAVTVGVDPNGDYQVGIVADDRVHQRTAGRTGWSTTWNTIEAVEFDSVGTTAISAS